MNLPLLAADIASRIPGMAQDTALNNADVIQQLIREEMKQATTKAVALVARWRKEADQYQAQVEQARIAGLPSDQMLAAMTYLRQSAKELETLLTK